MAKEVYVINPNSFDIVLENNAIRSFHKEVIEELGNCGVIYHEINNRTTNASLVDTINKGNILLAYNDNKKNPDVEALIDTAYEKGADIRFVAFTRETRTPCTGICELKEKQSYDIQEQLRCRGLTDKQHVVVARALARQIVACCFPTRFPDVPVIFLSHKRSDGEDITAKIHDALSKPALAVDTFRDVANVRFGEEAQGKIEKVMADTDVLVFLHTPEVPESKWILKELVYAMTRHIPVLWIQLYGADTKKLEIVPGNKPHLSYSKQQIDDKGINTIAQEILDKAGYLLLEKSVGIINYRSSLKKLFGDCMVAHNDGEYLYKICYERKGFVYPQRKIVQYVQLFGRTPHRADFGAMKKELEKVEDYDSAIIISDRTVRKTVKNKDLRILVDSLDNFYSVWNRYIYGEKEVDNMEIVISGAFPADNDIYQHCLTDAIILFEKEILTRGYELTFGAHPTFQELFYEVAKETCPKNYKTKLNMYISDYFIDKLKIDTSDFNDKFSWKKTESINGDKDKSLTALRETMIARKEVKALVCLGGMIREDKKQEGIREEIKIALAHNIPVFVVGSVGGCSSNVAKEYKKKGWDKINKAGDSINEMFMNGLDYREQARTMINYLEERG